MIFFCPLETILCTYVVILVKLNLLECTLFDYIYNLGDSVQSLGQEYSIENEYYPLQYSLLQNSMDMGTWRATIHRVTKSQT